MIRAMPVLQVKSVSASEQFYCEQLGFTSHGGWGDGPDFCIVQRGDVTIALDRARDGIAPPLNQYWAAYVYVDDADALLAELSRNDVAIVRQIEETPYGMRDFDIKDLDGHIIAFGHDIDPTVKSPGLRASAR